MTLRLTTEKKRKIFDHCQEVLLKETVSIRFVSKLLGKFTSLWLLSHKVCATPLSRPGTPKDKVTEN